MKRLLTEPLGKTHSHVWYEMSGNQASVPDLLVLKAPPCLAMDGCLLVIPAETPAERQCLDRALGRPMEVRPTLFGSLLVPPVYDLYFTQSALPVTPPMLVIYDPPCRGWPWLTLGIGPRTVADEVTLRGRYRWFECGALSELGAQMDEGVAWISEIFGSDNG